MMGKPIAGKYLLEILTKGMYSNPMHIFREYIQNAADSLDKAVMEKMITKEQAAIYINIDQEQQFISIKDNGTGISKLKVEDVLLSVGNSDKDGINERGFRGIGRLGGLAYAKSVKFLTSYVGESTKVVMTCDCVRLQELLLKSNKETNDVMETFTTISEVVELPEKREKHYFEIQLIGVPVESGLLDESAVVAYLSETAPVDFNDQEFIFGNQINEFFTMKGHPLTCYNIYRGNRKMPIYKPYSRYLNAGFQKRTKVKDYIREIKTFEGYTDNGELLYLGWIALTDFSGAISDISQQGIRFRKGNILIGNNTTLAKYFPSEKEVANRCFAGEIHIIHDGIIPNSQRDEFEPNNFYNILKYTLSIWTKNINTKYRRGTSAANSSIRILKKLNQDQEILKKQVHAGTITSDAKREKLSNELENIKKKRATELKKIEKAYQSNTFVKERIGTVEKIIKESQKAEEQSNKLSSEIIDAEYATKHDLPSSYSRLERKMYQKIIMIIDDYFKDEQDIAEHLRAAIKKGLSINKK